MADQGYEMKDLVSDINKKDKRITGAKTTLRAKQEEMRNLKEEMAVLTNRVLNAGGIWITSVEDMEFVNKHKKKYFPGKTFLVWEKVDKDTRTAILSTADGITKVR